MPDEPQGENMNKKIANLRKKKSGFTLIELLVVVLIIGILAAIAVPQYFKVVEKGRAAEAVALADAVRGAQERYLTKFGGYCTGTFTACTGFDMDMPAMKYFTQPTAAAAPGTTPGWRLSIVRNGTPASYGTYTITVDQEPGATVAYTCSNATCGNDLMP
jgi:prepilin-type N-terminal cleavage/methylation domain-containing protein